MATKKAAKPAAKATKTVAKPKFVAPQLPAGFKAITSGSYGEEWDYEKHPTLQGVVSSDVREVEQKPMRRGEKPRTTRVVTITSSEDGRAYTLWESASLRDFFDGLHRGMEVAVVYQGTKDVGRPQPMKLFVGAYTEEDAAALVDDAPPARASKKAPAKKSRR